MMEEERIGGGGSSSSNPKMEEVVYKTKAIQFLGRSTPIILQNDNGPCPLLAICNVLLLRNSLSLSIDASEVSLQKLLSLVAEKLIDSNTHVQDKDDEYVINQQQNIADAIDLLPRLATGIDVNVQFRKINDFEFTRECAIFDLLDIGLYHGWIVDPQDTDTASAIGSKSYNTLVGELVAFEASGSAGEDRNKLEEDSVDFAAATTAALGVPSPCLSRGKSFDDSPIPVPVDEGSEKGDTEELKELMRALNLSKTETPSPVNVSVSPDATYQILEGSSQIGCSRSDIHLDSPATQIGFNSEESQQADLVAPQQFDASVDFKNEELNSNTCSTENGVLSTSNNTIIKLGDNPLSEDSAEIATSSSLAEDVTDLLKTSSQGPSRSVDGEGPDGCDASQMCTGYSVTSQLPSQPAGNPVNYDSAVLSVSAVEYAGFPSENERKDFEVGLLAAARHADLSEGNDFEVGLLAVPTAEHANFHPNNDGKDPGAASSSLDDSEPIYEGEECILDSELPKYEDQEPVYEGEMVLAQQADKLEEDACVNSKVNVGLQQCSLIRKFLENSASQLTIYGLFCLQEGLKERELCVFFRNNHFNTMFKFNGELYLLATDQGYINQPDLVWEKLNEVNGDTVFMTGNFKEFNIENQVSESWSEQNAMTSTADYLATLEASAPTVSSFSSDLQLAIALQQQEFGQQSQQQPQRSQQQSSQQSAVGGRSRHLTGSQVSRSQHAPQKNESKKDKCTIM